MNYDSYAEKLQDHSHLPRLIPDVLTTDNYTYCPWATTVTGYDVNSEKWVAVGVTCKRWGCLYCATRKVRRLAWMTRNAQPTRLITLTVSNQRYRDGATAWSDLAPKFAELVRFQRKGPPPPKNPKERPKWRGGAVEYLRVLEVQQNGMPHFHCLVRCNFVPQWALLSEWRRLIGRPDDYDANNPSAKAYGAVNIKLIDKSFATFRYLVKYLTKLHKIEWTDRHVSYSRNFFREEDKEQVEYAKLASIEKHEEHPWVYLRERFDGDPLTSLRDGCFEFYDGIPLKRMEVTREQCGLPSIGSPKQPPPKLEQRLVPGMEDVDRPDEDAPRRKNRRKHPPTRDVPF